MLARTHTRGLTKLSFAKPEISQVTTRFINTDSELNNVLPVNFEDVSKAAYRIRDGINIMHRKL